VTGDRLYYKQGYKYQTCRDFSYPTGICGCNPIMTDYLTLETDGILTVKKGYAWDGASGPTIDTRSSMRGALVHDSLYQLMRLGLLPESFRKTADDLLHDICKEDGMWGIRADVWERAVRWFAGKCARNGSEQKECVAP